MREKIVSGILWSTLQLFLSKAVSYLVVLLLAYSLNPEDFGLLGMATVFTGLIVSLGNTAITAALVQIKTSLAMDETYRSARSLVFILNLATWVIYTTLIAPLAAKFYGQPILNTLIPILALQGLIGAFNIIPRAQLSRELKFKSIAIAESFGAMLAGVITVALAFYGFGLWALVAQTLLVEACQTPLLRRFAQDKGTFEFSRERLLAISKFTTFDTLNRSFLYFTKNFDYLLVGKLLGAQLLGAYTFAFMATDILRAQVMNVLNRVMFPVYGKIQDDPALIKTYYLKIVRFNILILSPMMLFFLFFADTWVPRLLGAKWEDAIFPMQAMAVGSIIHAFGGTTDSVLKAIGRVDLVFRIQIFKTLLVSIPAFTIGIIYFGLNGAAVAIVVHKLVGRVIYQYYMNKFLLVTHKDLLLAAKPVLIGLIGATLALFALDLSISSDALLALTFETLVVLLISVTIPLCLIREEIVDVLKGSPGKPTK